MTAADKPWNQPIAEEDVSEMAVEFLDPPSFHEEIAKASMALVLTKPYWGENDDDGVNLLVSYLETVGHKMQRPDYVILLHNAATLASSTHPAFEALRRLGDTGTSVLFLSEYRDEEVGMNASMDEIVSIMMKVDKVITF